MYNSVTSSLKKLLRTGLTEENITREKQRIRRLKYSDSKKNLLIDRLQLLPKTGLFDRNLNAISGIKASSEIDGFEISACPCMVAEENGIFKYFIFTGSIIKPEEENTVNTIKAILCFYYRVLKDKKPDLKPSDIEFISLKVPYSQTGDEDDCNSIKEMFNRVKGIFHQVWETDFGKEVA